LTYSNLYQKIGEKWRVIKAWLQKPRVLNILRILALVLVIGLSVFILFNADKIESLKILGYPGIFLMALVLNASLFLPMPMVIITSLMGTVFHPAGVALAAGLGSTVGELSGYLAGFSGQAVVERMDIYEKVSGWIKKYGDFAIFFLALIPNPLFDAAGIIAGMMKLPLARFLIWCAAGKILKMLAFAYLGDTLVRWFPIF